MSDGVPLRRGDVVIVSLGPPAGHGTQETWPAVVVQNDVGNKHAGTTIVAPATRRHRGYPFEVLVRADGSPFDSDSSVRLDQLRVVSIERRVRSVLGRLDAATRSAIDDALRVSLGLD